jgi:hypothetical protein
MPQADITGDYRSDRGQSRFPRLKLQALEKARIFVASKPVVEYVHRLEAPNIVNMAPSYKKIQNREGQDQFVVDTRFVSGPLCQGNFDVLQERHVDDKNCYACQMARDRPDIFRNPTPKYAANVLRYGLRPGGGWNDIANPFGVSALIWVFGGKVMDKLIDIRSMGGPYEDIRAVDLLLECDKDQVFQKPYSNGEFLPMAPAIWLSNEATRKYTIEYLQSNGATPEDLTAAIGKKVKADWLADDISRVIQRWDVVRAYESRGQGGPVMPQGFGAETLQQGMGQLQNQYAQGYGGQGSGNNIAYGGNGAPPQGAGGGGGYGGQPSQGGGFQPQTAGVDMGLLGGNFQPQPPPPPAPPAPPQGDYMAAAQQAAQLGQNPVTAAYETATGQPMPPPAPPATFVPPTNGTGAMPTDLAPPAAPTVSAPSAATAPVPFPTPASPPSSGPPQGLDGLNEFMAGSTSNPSMEAQPSVPPAQLAPPSAPAAQPEPGKSWTFEDLKNLAGPS